MAIVLLIYCCCWQLLPSFVRHQRHRHGFNVPHDGRSAHRKVDNETRGKDCGWGPTLTTFGRRRIRPLWRKWRRVSKWCFDFFSIADLFSIFYYVHCSRLFFHRFSLNSRQGGTLKGWPQFLSLFWPPPPLWTQNDDYDVIVTNTDRIWPTPSPWGCVHPLSIPP